MVGRLPDVLCINKQLVIPNCYLISILICQVIQDSLPPSMPPPQLPESYMTADWNEQNTTGEQATNQVRMSQLILYFYSLLSS